MINLTEEIIYNNVKTLYILQYPEKLFIAFMIILGLFMISKLFWMCIYQYYFGGNAGEDYLKYGKNYVKNTYKKSP